MIASALIVSYTVIGVMSVDPCELTAAVTAFANVISRKLTVNELSLLSAVLSQLGDTLATIAAQRSFLEESTEQTDRF